VKFEGIKETGRKKRKEKLQELLWFKPSHFLSSLSLSPFFPTSQPSFIIANE